MPRGAHRGLKLVQLHCLGVAGCAVCALFLISCSGGPNFTHPGWQIYKESGCARCHTFQLHGGPKGPTLENLKSHWTQEQLATYLENPREYIKTAPRLQELVERYDETMPMLRMSDESRRQLAEFLLDPQ